MTEQVFYVTNRPSFGHNRYYPVGEHTAQAWRILTGRATVRPEDYAALELLGFTVKEAIPRSAAREDVTTG